MAEPNLSELETATQVDIMPSVADGFFKAGPIIRYLRENRLKTYRGGSEIQDNLLYAPLKGGFFRKGDQFDITRRRTTTGLKFGPKKAYVNVTEEIADIELELNSAFAVFDTVRADMANAALTMSAILEIAAMQDGQNVAGDDRLPAFNGFSEALNDGTNASWDGKTFTSYGQQLRADMNGALTPPTGDINANVNGPINNHVLEHSYQSCVIGDEHPKLGVTTSRCTAFINENYQPQQRLVDTVEPVIGWPGIKFKQATIVESQYMPGARGVNDPDLGNYLTPDGGETFLWMNPGGEGDDAYVRLHIAASPLFQFGFTGWKVAKDDISVSGQVLFAGNIILRNIRLMRLLHGILS